MNEHEGDQPVDETPETTAPAASADEAFVNDDTTAPEQPAPDVDAPKAEAPADGPAAPSEAPTLVIPPYPPVPERPAAHDAGAAPASSAERPASSVEPAAAPVAQTPPSTPVAQSAPAPQSTPAPQTTPAAHTPQQPATPAAQTPQQPATPAAWQPPHHASAPGPVPPGYAAQPQSYGRPQAYAGQQTAPTQAYAGHAPHGSAFGARPGDSQPTLPIDGSPVAPVPKREKSGASKVVGLIVAAALVGGAAGLGGAYAGVNLFTPAASSPASGPSTVTVNNTESVNPTTGIAAKVLPSVVTIAAASGSGAGTGSGVVLTSDGYVVTNTHVVTLDGATGDAAIRVTTSDGRVFDAEVVGTDPTYDLAVIKLNGAEDLTPIDFADSSNLNVGDQTVAVGAPLGLANTVTTGIVSALNRSIEIASAAAPEGDATEEDGGESEQGQAPFQFDFGQGQQGGQSAAESIKIAVIQTDAAINPGNSGGALVDGEGKLIGINVAIASAGGSSGTAGSIGVGFAIPSNVVERITAELIEDGAATHGLLGASVQSAAFVEGVSITGAYIAEVVDGGAAAGAGLEVGDIVTEFNGAPITDSVDLTAQVRAAAAGSEGTLTFVRDGRSQTTDVTLGELP